MAEQFITIPPVTSLADLEFKAKTDKRYQQLAILGYKSVAYGRTRVNTFKNAMKGLYRITLDDRKYTDTCSNITKWVNGNRDKIKPEPETVCSLAETNPQKIVDSLKKLKKARPSRKAV